MVINITSGHCKQSAGGGQCVLFTQLHGGQLPDKQMELREREEGKEGESGKREGTGCSAGGVRWRGV